MYTAQFDGARSNVNYIFFTQSHKSGITWPRLGCSNYSTAGGSKHLIESYWERATNPDMVYTKYRADQERHLNISTMGSVCSNKMALQQNLVLWIKPIKECHPPIINNS